MYHIFDICQEIGHKMKDPRVVCETIQDQINRNQFLNNTWNDFSLSDGLSGIIVYFASLHQIFPDQSWDHVGHEYLKLLINKIGDSSINSYSLFEGLAGFNFAVYLSSQNESRYPSLLSTTDQVFFNEIQNLHKQIDYLLNQKDVIAPHIYNLTSGLTGIIAHLLLRKQNLNCHNLLVKSLSRLIQILQRKVSVKNYLLPGWHVHKTDAIQFEEKKEYDDGCFLLTVPDGILGCLSILSISALEGVTVSGQLELIEEISAWIVKKKGKDSSFGIYWHHTFSCEEEVSDSHDSIEIARDIWNYGTPAVSRSLFLAAKATKNHTLQQFAEESFLSIFSKKWQDRHLMGPTFMTGRAGLLALTIAMALDTQHPLLLKQVDELSIDLKRFYSPMHPFGFQTVGYRFSTYCWIDHPGLLNGAIGIALTLLMSHFKTHTEWSRILLLR